MHFISEAIALQFVLQVAGSHLPPLHFAGSHFMSLQVAGSHFSVFMVAISHFITGPLTASAEAVFESEVAQHLAGPTS